MHSLLGVQGKAGIPQPVKAPPFTLAERDRRWSVIRRLMSDAGVDTLIVFPEWQSSDAFYIADTSGVTIFPLDGDPTLILGGEASNLAVKEPSWIDDRHSASDHGTNAVHYGEVTVEALRDRNLLGGTIAVAGLKAHTLASVRSPDGYVNYTSVKAVEAAAKNPIVDGTAILAEARYIKSEEEIERLTASLLIAEKAVEAMVRAAGEGVPQSEVFAEILAAEVRAGADTLHCAWLAGQWGEHRHRYVTTPRGLLTDGTYVSVELMPEVRCYEAQIPQPLVIGEPNAQAREIFDLNAAAFDMACESLKPGADWGEAEQKILALADDTPYEIVLLLHGRGLGNDGPLLIPAADHSFAHQMPIVKDTVFVCKPFATPRDAESRITRQFDVTWGDTIVVRDSGAERLGTRSRELPVC